jgi:hypothetical protein
MEEERGRSQEGELIVLVWMVVRRKKRRSQESSVFKFIMQNLLLPVDILH